MKPRTISSYDGRQHTAQHQTGYSEFELWTRDCAERNLETAAEYSTRIMRRANTKPIAVVRAGTIAGQDIGDRSLNRPTRR